MTKGTFMTKKFISITIILNLFIFCFAQAQTNHQAINQAWQPIGPEGAEWYVDFHSAKSNALGDMLYITTISNELYYSGDHGHTWHISSENGLPDYGTDFKDAYFATKKVTYTQSMGAIYKSIDGGEHWIKVLNGENPDERFNYVTGINEQVVFAMSHNIHGSKQRTLYKTIDGGVHWQAIKTPLNFDADLYAISENTLIYVANYSNTLWRSTDGGNTWKKLPLNAGKNHHIRQFHVIDNALLMLVESANEDETLVYNSLDNGETWSMQSKVGRYFDTDKLSFVNLSTGYLISDHSNVSKTIDGGKSWKKLNLNIPIVPVLSIKALSETEVYVATAIGFFKSSDGGSHWQKLVTGISSLEVNNIASYNGKDLYLITNRTGLIYHSADEGHHWDLLYNDVLGGGLLSVTPTEDNVLFIYQYGVGLYKSENGGHTWVLVLDHSDGDDPTMVVEKTQVSAPSKDIIYVNPSVIHWGNLPAQKSTDGGKHWYNIADNFTDKHFDYLLVESEKELYAAANQQLFYSNNGGSNWVFISTLPSDKRVHAIYHPKDNTFYVAFSDDLIKSTDNGLTWDQAHKNWPTARYQTDRRDNFAGFHCVNQNHCFLAFKSKGVDETLDGGKTWLAHNEGFSVNHEFGQMLALPGKLIVYGINAIAQQVYSLDI